MHCMKCGIEIEDGQVFCESCLADMKRYPVKPEAKIQLPSRPTQEAVKKPTPRNKVLTPEKKILRLQKTVKWLSTALVVALLLVSFSCYLLAELITEKPAEDNIGQNYNTIEQDNS